jgi:hypothetical protein
MKSIYILTSHEGIPVEDKFGANAYMKEIKAENIKWDHIYYTQGEGDDAWDYKSIEITDELAVEFNEADGHSYFYANEVILLRRGFLEKNPNAIFAALK